MTREQAIKIARKIPVDGTLKEAVDAVLAIDRAAREECLQIVSNEADNELSWGHPRRALTLSEACKKIHETMEEK